MQVPELVRRQEEDRACIATTSVPGVRIMPPGLLLAAWQAWPRIRIRRTHEYQHRSSRRSGDSETEVLRNGWSAPGKRESRLASCLSDHSDCVRGHWVRHLCAYGAANSDSYRPQRRRTQ